MRKKTLALAGVLAAALLAPAPTAQAVGRVEVHLQGCEVTFTNNSGLVADVDFGEGSQRLAATGPGRVYRFTPPADTYDYKWIAQNQKGGVFDAGVLTVPASCGARRQGDHNGDDKADVVGIQAGTGDLYYYRNVGGRLASGVKVGRGWDRMVHLHQTAGMPLGPGFMATPSLIAVRNDGAVFSYPQLGSGKYGTPTRIATAPTGMSAFTVLEADHYGAKTSIKLLGVKNGQMTGLELSGLPSSTRWSEWSPSDAVHLISMVGLPLGDVPNEGNGSPFRNYTATLMAIKGDGTLEHYVVDMDGGYPLTGKVGHGWKPMQVVTSPGSLDGDWTNDVIGRRTDGNLYSYRGLNNGRLGPAVRIGQNWQKMRVLA